ncbi:MULTISPECIES: hypothetical protein [unclassified Exiguobacterium]|uniref:hypothetical protein n=1 Tax=unclassified Exiguobacterium TaxID=2644629 RepID=UPI001BE90273|nr:MULTISPECIES: hypothetical protein [unclassified Exiguobacterium]
MRGYDEWKLRDGHETKKKLITYCGLCEQELYEGDDAVNDGDVTFCNDDCFKQYYNHVEVTL